MDLTVSGELTLFSSRYRYPVHGRSKKTTGTGEVIMMKDPGARHLLVSRMRTARTEPATKATFLAITVASGETKMSM
jgi:hypothetical protein